MYGPVKRSKFKDEATALLDEISRAIQKSRCTHDISTEEFLPWGWHERLRKYLKEAEENCGT